MDTTLLKKIASEFNECLSLDKYQDLTINEKFQFDDLVNGIQVVTNRSNNQKLQKLFFENFIPKSRCRIYHHFTTLDAFKSIIKNENLWLSAVSKRFSEKEFRTFYKVHKMDGYAKRVTKDGISLDKDLCDNSFFLSLTGKDISDVTAEHLATAFSESNKGVRLVFSIKRVRTDLRNIYYSGKEIPLLKDFNEIVNRHKKYLIIERISKFGFFFLPGILNIEDEYRLFINREKATRYNLEFAMNKVEKYEFLKLPLFNNPLIDISLQKVILLDNRSESVVRETLNSNSKFSSVRIEYC